MLIRYNAKDVIIVTSINTIPILIIVLINPVLILIKYVSTGDRINDNIINNNIVIINYFSILINFMFFSIFLVTKFVFNKIFTKNAIIVPRSIPFIPRNFINIIDNIRLVTAHINICFLLSLNNPSALISATSG